MHTAGNNNKQKLNCQQCVLSRAVFNGSFGLRANKHIFHHGPINMNKTASKSGSDLTLLYVFVGSLGSHGSFLFIYTVEHRTILFFYTWVYPFAWIESHLKEVLSSFWVF